MHKCGSYEHCLYLTELEWNRSNTFLSSDTFFERNYLFGYMVSNSLKKYFPENMLSRFKNYIPHGSSPYGI